ITSDPVFTNHVSVSIDHTPSLPQQEIVMTNATTETTAPEVATSQPRLTQLLDMSLDRMGMIKYDVRTLEARVDVAELRAEILQFALENAREEIMDLRTRVSALE
ncbi:hypothetical protein Tco_1453363, partial [Tanacetum coccineum]